MEDNIHRFCAGWWMIRNITRIKPLGSLRKASRTVSLDSLIRSLMRTLNIYKQRFLKPFWSTKGNIVHQYTTDRARLRKDPGRPDQRTGDEVVGFRKFLLPRPVHITRSVGSPPGLDIRTRMGRCDPVDNFTKSNGTDRFSSRKASVYQFPPPPPIWLFILSVISKCLRFLRKSQHLSRPDSPVPGCLQDKSAAGSPQNGGVVIDIGGKSIMVWNCLITAMI